MLMIHATGVRRKGVSRQTAYDWIAKRVGAKIDLSAIEQRATDTDIPAI